MTAISAFHAVAHGHVQGVFYRAFTAKTATSLGLTGYVRNLPDNSVEITAEGNQEQLIKLVEQLKQGPPSAIVDNLTVTWSDYTGKYKDFSVT